MIVLLTGATNGPPVSLAKPRGKHQDKERPTEKKTFSIMSIAH